MNGTTSEEELSGLRGLLAREAIRDRLYVWARGVDRHDRELQESVFFPDSTDNHGVFNGPAAEFITWLHAHPFDWKMTHHMIGNVIVVMQSPRQAEVESYFIAHHAKPDPSVEPPLVLLGRYFDRFELRDGSWRIAHRQVIVDWQSPTGEDYGFLTGHRGGDDVTSQAGFGKPA
jgi:hypothetical protein